MQPLMTERNLQYLILRIRSTFYKGLSQADRATVKAHENKDIRDRRAQKCESWTSKDIIESESALAVINKVLAVAGISINQLCDPDVTTSDLFTHFQINGASWVEYLLDCLEAEGVPLSYQQAFTIGKNDVNEMVGRLGQPFRGNQNSTV